MTWTEPVWVWAGILIWVMSFFQGLWLTAAGIMKEYSNVVRERVDALQSLNDEKQREIDLEYETESSKDKIQIEIDHSLPGGYNKSYRFLTINPSKMKTLALACLNGTPFSVRTWAGNGKLLTDNEWRTLKDELLEGGYIQPRSEKDDRQGFIWTELGNQLLRDCVEDVMV